MIALYNKILMSVLLTMEDVNRTVIILLVVITVGVTLVIVWALIVTVVLVCDNYWYMCSY